MEYYCQACKKEFESEERRCPACMRQTSVVERSKMQSTSASTTASTSLFRGPGLVVTIIILVPLVLLNQMEWRLGWWFTFLSALVGFGAGHVVNYFWHKSKAGK